MVRRLAYGSLDGKFQLKKSDEKHITYVVCIVTTGLKRVKVVASHSWKHCMKST
jgi:hypothetical protein